MDIVTLSNVVIRDSEQDGLFDLFPLNIVYVENEFFEYTIQEWQEMRIDLVFQELYDIEPQLVGLYLGDIDVLCKINNIENPINIKRDMIIRYPRNREDLSTYRVSGSYISDKRKAKPLLAVPNVSTVKDKTREQYTKANYSLPPVATPNPRPGVIIENGKINVGGIN